ncbi:uncharacterized protein LTR77_008552 [Saxophila tyrrhenica]|uniref:PH domain-like protein n=1 Tax=Saxophila tyrrhenica TaxID=1690608 RepID=A0AAV9P1A9_9PEZI|nr:hypothetical protein LTR77_008552 [Saxophila tyrrhenica]
MPSKKANNKATRAAQPHAQPVQDYETDTDAALTSGPMAAPPPNRTNTQLNFSVLRRYVPDVERIISIAPFAVVYTFSPDSQQWEKSGVEGTLFVCQLSASPNPRYNVVILNRKSLDNFITELVSEDDIEITEQYVILQVLGENDVPTIYGLWIFSDEGEGVHSTREIVAHSIQECAMRAAHANLAAAEESQEDYEASAPYGFDGTSDGHAENNAPQPKESGQSIDLLSLFGTSTSQPPATNGNVTSPPATRPVPEQSHFVPTADTDFFRSTGSPGATFQGHSRPPLQQDMLLNLFKSANHG